MNNPSKYPWLDGIAVALEYPGAATAGRCLEAAQTLPEGQAAMANALTALGNWLAQAAHGTDEEWYGRLFDLSPVCTLNIGYHLFGEQYERGAFLAGLVAEHRRAGLAPPDDLPDHLPTLLRLLGRLEDAQDASLMVSHALLPALDRMRADLRSSEAPWVAVLEAMPGFLESTFDVVGIPQDQYPTREKTFLGQRELPIGSMSLGKRRGRAHA